MRINHLGVQRQIAPETYHGQRGRNGLLNFFSDQPGRIEAEFYGHYKQAEHDGQIKTIVLKKRIAVIQFIYIDVKRTANLTSRWDGHFDAI